MGKEGFNNPIVAASGTLVRLLMKSVNYIAGVSGWQITRDGDAEFNDVSVRGELIVTDPDGSQVRIYDQNPGDGAVIELRPADEVGHTVAPGSIITQADPGGGYPRITITSPQLDSSDRGFIEVNGGDDTDVNPEHFGYIFVRGKSGIRMDSHSHKWYNGSTIVFDELIGELTEAGGFNSVDPTSTINILETWHDLAFQNFWVNRAGGYPKVQYRYNLAPARTVSLTGQMKNGTIAAGTTINNPAIPAEYRPAAPQAVKVITAGGAGQAEIGTNGFIRLFDIPAGTTIIGFNCEYPLDPPGLP